MSAAVQPRVSATSAERVAANVRATGALLFGGRRVRIAAARPALRRTTWRAVAMVVAAAAAMLLLDAPLAALARDLPPWARAAGEVMSDLGLSGWFLFPLGGLLVVLALAGGLHRSRMDRAALALLAGRAGFLFVAIGLPGLTVTILKRLIGRARPYVHDAFTYAPLRWDSNYASLPSGHAVTAFAALVALGAVWPRLRPFLWAYALVVAAARVVVSAHYPSDVIAGAAFGIVGATLVQEWFALRRVGLVVAPDGTIRAQTFPSWGRLKKAARLPSR